MGQAAGSAPFSFVRPHGESAVNLVVPYDTRWPAIFAEEALALRIGFRGTLVAIEHIGSTAVAQLSAKPIVDILGIAASLRAVDQRVAAAGALGYEALGEYGIAGRRYFRRSDGLGRRSHHLHVFAAGAPEIERHLAFRDYLRAHPSIAADYAALKIVLAGRDDYQQAKAPFVLATIEAAIDWRRRSGAAERR